MQCVPFAKLRVAHVAGAVAGMHEAWPTLLSQVFGASILQIGLAVDIRKNPKQDTARSLPRTLPKLEGYGCSPQSNKRKWELPRRKP